MSKIFPRVVIVFTLIGLTILMKSNLQNLSILFSIHVMGSEHVVITLFKHLITITKFLRINIDQTQSLNWTITYGLMVTTNGH